MPHLASLSCSHLHLELVMQLFAASQHQCVSNLPFIIHPCHVTKCLSREGLTLRSLQALLCPNLIFINNI